MNTNLIASVYPQNTHPNRIQEGDGRYGSTRRRQQLFLGLSRSLVKTLRCYCSWMCTAQPQKRPSNILLFLTGQLRFNKWQSTSPPHSPPLSSVHFTSWAKSLSLVCITDCLRGWVGSLSLVLNRPGCFICQGLIGTPHLLVRHGKVIADITRTIVAKLSLCHWHGETMCADHWNHPIKWKSTSLFGWRLVQENFPFLWPKTGRTVIKLV